MSRIRVTVTYGPLLNVDAWENGPGDRFDSTGDGQLAVRITNVRRAVDVSPGNRNRATARTKQKTHHGGPSLTRVNDETFSINRDFHETPVTRTPRTAQ